MRIRAYRWVLSGAIVLGVFASVASPASATFLAQGPMFALGPVTKPNAISVDQATGNVYVTDHATSTVRIFGSEGGPPTAGVPTEVTGIETPAGAFSFLGSGPVGVAIDESEGLLYVADVGHEVIDKFKLEGGVYRYACQFTGFGNVGDGCMPNLLTHETSPSAPFTRAGGVAVDAHGNVYVSDFGGAVYEFNSAGEDVRQATIPSGSPAGLAVDSDGIVYVQDFQGPVYKLTLNISNEFEATEVDSEESRAVTVAPITNDVFIDHFEYIVIRESAQGKHTGAVVGELHPSELSSEGVAVDGASQELYISNKLTESIEVFKLTRVPDIELPISEPPEAHAESATLHGEINPEGISGSSYYFEYGPIDSAAPRATTTAEELLAVNEFTPVETTLTGLQPNTEYGYRLVVDSSGGLTASAEGRFTTLRAKPEVSGLEALDITASSVIFGGEVNPENTPPTTYRFEYGEAEGALQRLPDVGIGPSISPIPVEQAVPAGLKPDTAYRFRLMAFNSAGETVSSEQSFTTPPAFITPSSPPTADTGPAESISPNGALLTGRVSAEGLPTLYEFEVGATTTYGTTLFGGEAGRGLEFVGVAQAVGGLLSGVTYHYRLVAFNTAGVRVGLDQTFTTTTPPSGVVQPGTLPILPTPVFPPVKVAAIKAKQTQHSRAKKKHRPKTKHHKKKSHARRAKATAA
jgi:hypothetical protein